MPQMIVVGAHDLTNVHFKTADGQDLLPRNAILYNFELVTPLLPQTAFPDAVQLEYQHLFVRLHRRYRVWDYSW
jgi:hypothetical protein